MTNNNDDAPEGGRVLLNNKTIWFFGEINVMSTGNFIAALEEADRKAGRIVVNICSGGGWVEGGLAMYDAITCARNQVITVGSGAIYSSAILPFQAGDHRVLYPNARLFFHDMSVTMGSVTAKSALTALKEVDVLYSQYCDLVSKRSKLSPKDISAFCQEETYMVADRALALNLIDEVVSPVIKVPKKSRRK
jgi:ATP-dependent Clp protease protease subunit